MPHTHRSTAPIVLRAFLALPLIFLAGFSGFGFLASFELAEWSQRLPWLIGYTLIGLASLRGVIALLRPRGTKAAPHREER